MKTYFVRHSSKLDIDKHTLEMLWEGNYFGIHYPHDRDGTLSQHDARSTDPNDYKGKAKSCMLKLQEIAKNGGYVFSVYEHQSGGKIGYVEPNSKVELLSGNWGRKNGLEGREATLKVIKLSSSKNLSAQESISLKSVQPRQGTVCHWRKVETRVESLLYGKTDSVVGSLTPDLQEVMCMEFLRTEAAKKHGLPILKYTLSPVGRTLKDLDIIGMTQEDSFISAQVTYHPLGAADLKLKKLNSYVSEKDFTIYFCKCKEPTLIDNHIIFPLDLVFKEFCIENKLGEKWFKRVTSA